MPRTLHMQSLMWLTKTEYVAGRDCVKGVLLQTCISPAVYSLPHFSLIPQLLLIRLAFTAQSQSKHLVTTLRIEPHSIWGQQSPGNLLVAAFCCMPIADGGSDCQRTPEACLWVVLYGSRSQLRKHMTNLMRNCCTSVRGAEEGQQGGRFGRKGRRGGRGGGRGLRSVVGSQLCATAPGQRPQNKRQHCILSNFSTSHCCDVLRDFPLLVGTKNGQYVTIAAPGPSCNLAPYKPALFSLCCNVKSCLYPCSVSSNALQCLTSAPRFQSSNRNMSPTTMPIYHAGWGCCVAAGPVPGMGATRDRAPSGPPGPLTEQPGIMPDCCDLPQQSKCKCLQPSHLLSLLALVDPLPSCCMSAI